MHVGEGERGTANSHSYVLCMQEKNYGLATTLKSDEHFFTPASHQKEKKKKKKKEGSGGVVGGVGGGGGSRKTEPVS